MKLVIAGGPVTLLKKAEFKPGYMFGLAGPACIVQMQLASDIEAALEKSASTLHDYLGKPEFPAAVDECGFARSVRQIAHWYLKAHDRFGLIIHSAFWLGNRASHENGTASFTLVLPYRFGRPSFTLLALVLNLINAAATGRSNAAELASMVSFSETLAAQYRESGQNIPDLLKAAVARGIPFHFIEGQTFRFGLGARQRILESTFTDETKVIGVRLSRNKINTAKILNDAGLPGGTPVRVRRTDDAIKAADRIGFPVVVKPIDSDGGAGVSADLRSTEDLVKAFEIAHQVSPNVMIDRHIEGTGHRFTVIFGQINKVTAKAPWGVVGDGVSTIAELVEKKLQSQALPGNQRLSADFARGLDEEALSLLRQYRMQPTSVLGADVFLALRRRNNANAGGSTVRLELDKVHKDNLALALRVADLFMLDVAGVDLIIPDISKSWLEQQCLICDVNSKPQIGLSVCAKFLDTIIPGTGRVPVTLVLFSGSHSPVLHSGLQDILKALNIDSMSSSAGIWINNAQAARAGLDGFHAAVAVLSYRDVCHPAVMMSVDEVHASGLPADQFQQLVIVAKEAAISSGHGLQLHTAGMSTRESVERDMVHAGIAEDPLQASLLLEKIWPHFRQDA